MDSISKDLHIVNLSGYKGVRLCASAGTAYECLELAEFDITPAFCIQNLQLPIETKDGGGRRVPLSDSPQYYDAIWTEYHSGGYSCGIWSP